jgi:hypothetical protein
MHSLGPGLYHEPLPKLATISIVCNFKLECKVAVAQVQMVLLLRTMSKCKYDHGQGTLPS